MGGIGMGVQGGRNDDPALHEVGLADRDEELDIQPNYELLRGEGASRGVVAWSKKSGVGERVAEKQGPDEDPPEGQVLDINPRVPDFRVTGKVQNTGFGGKANEDATRRGAKEALDHLDREKEQLDLQPVVANDRPKNTQASWKKESDAAVSGDAKGAMKGYVDEEELVLAPRDTAGKHPNTLPSWGKQATKGNDRPDLVGINSETEELILSPRQQEDNRRSAAPSWSKQADPAEAKLSVLDEPDELILEPKKTSDKKQKSGVPWNKQRDSAYDTNASVDREMVEELILSPREIRGNKDQASIPWKNQPDREYIGYAKEIQQPSEELILSPKEVRTSRGKTPLSWKRQSDAAFDVNKSLDKEIEELILSPKFKATEKSSVGNDIGASWKTQASRVLSDAKAGYEQSEELKLSPKDHRKKEPASTLRWSRQSDAFDAPNSTDKAAEELYLSPNDNRATGGGNVSSMKSTANRDGGMKTAKQSAVTSAKLPGTSDLKGKSKLSVSFQESPVPVKDDKKRAGSASSRTSRSGSTPSATSKKATAPRSVSKDGKSRSSATSSSQKSGISTASPRPSSVSATSSDVAGRSGQKTSSRTLQPRESAAPTPPRVSAPSPYAAAPPEGFRKDAEIGGVSKRTNADVMASLDKKIEQLELYD
jgi:hypothetical protein